MKTYLLSAVAALLTFAGLATAQEPSVVPGAQPDWIMGSLDNGILPPEGNGLPPMSPPCQPAENCGQCDHPAFVWHQDVDRCVPHVWAGADYLLWWVKNGPAPLPLLTVGQVTSITNDATLDPYAPALVGSNGFDYGTASGVRAHAGGWFGCDQIVGLEGVGFLLPRLGTGSTVSVVETFSGDSQSVTPDATTTNLLTEPGTVEKLTSYSRLWGAEANLLLNVLRNNYCELTLLGGFRFVDLAESIHYTAQYTGEEEELTSVLAQYSWQTQNRFYGGQLGGKFETGWGCFFINSIGTCALGCNYEKISANGETTTTIGGIQTVTRGGIVTNSSNLDNVRQERFAVVPEVQVNVGWQICPCARLSVGYDFLYWSNVVRPGNQIDTTADSRPQTDFWAHGVTAGLELRF